MPQRSVPVLSLLAFCAGCSDVARVPRDGKGEGGGTEPAQGNVSVSVVDRGIPIAGLDILVHGPAGELRGRYVSEARALDVQAEPGGSVAVVWQDPDWEGGDIGWNLFSVRVVPGMPVITISIATRLADAPLNPPIQIEATLAEPKGIAERSLWLPCGVGGHVPRGGAFVENDYRGCPWSSQSVVVATGYDSAGRLSTFDQAVVTHDGSTTVSLQFPMTPIEVGQAAVDIVWSSVDVSYLQGGAWWSVDEGFYHQPEAIPIAMSNPQAPTTVAFPVLQSAKSATHVSLFAAWNGAPNTCSEGARLRATANEDRTWRLDRLAQPTIDDESETWGLSDSGDRGDALVIDRRQRTSRLRWIEPAPTTLSQTPLVIPELPADLFDRFNSNSDPSFEIYVEDRDDTEGYAAYVADGAGEPRLIDDGKMRERGETRGRDTCKGRY
ncbi:MAG: hypothetical protein HOV80_36855 [Polyangiaceae bacterium]|nr:hypothetical protein [Polyangiaceae bacterium]